MSRCVVPMAEAVGAVASASRRQMDRSAVLMASASNRGRHVRDLTMWRLARLIHRVGGIRGSSANKLKG